jgi:HAD superfamily hydrolase (TIGR01459 family)
LIFERKQLRALVEEYDAFLIDQFGVLLDGSKAYPGATKALALIAEHRKPVVILSNSGKRSQVNCDRITAHGFDRDHFIDVVTSGEIAHKNIAQAIGTSIAKDARVIVFARDGDPSPVADLGLVETRDPSQAEVLLIVSRELSTKREDYRAMMAQFDKRKGRCICLNPDLKMLTPQGLAFSAGSIAKDFQAMGGTVEWYGKPHPRIYQSALTLMPDIPLRRILCIGDSIEHDIQGGYDAGLSTALVRVGVHAHLSDAEIRATFSRLNVTPDHIITSFSLDG